MSNEERAPVFFVVYRGWNPTQLYGGQPLQGSLLTNQYLMESKARFFDRGSHVLDFQMPTALRCHG